MKRNQNLIPLSREHNDGLMLILAVRRGIEQGVAPDILANYLIDTWRVALVPHFEEEESVLLPAIPGGDELKTRTLDEHHRLYALVAQIQKQDENLAAYLKQFCELLDRHIRFEERELFPFAEQHIPEEKLNEIGHIFHHTSKEPEESGHQNFWQAGSPAHQEKELNA